MKDRLRAASAASPLLLLVACSDPAQGSFNTPAPREDVVDGNAADSDVTPTDLPEAKPDVATEQPDIVEEVATDVGPPPDPCTIEGSCDACLARRGCGYCAADARCAAIEGGASNCRSGWSTSAQSCRPTCAPQCAGRTCGSDGCGGSCGSCAAGRACLPTGACAECAEGATQCISGSSAQVRRCVSGRWTTSSCGAFSLCADSACRSICGTLPARLTGSLICIVPSADGVNNGVVFLTNDSVRFGTTANWNGGAFTNPGVPAPVLRTSASWPFAWRISAANIEASGNASFVFRLNSYRSPVSRVALWVSSRRANVRPANVTEQLWAFSANASARPFGAATEPITTAFREWEGFVSLSTGVTTRSFSYNTTFNSVSWGPIGNRLGSPGDDLDLNWMLLQITQ